MPSVLFVCTANRFRSPLAEGIFRKALAEQEKEKTTPWDIGRIGDWEAGSAGTWAVPGLPALPHVVEAADQLGIDLTSHRSQRVSAELLSRYDLILVVQETHREMLVNEFPPFKDQIYLLSQVINHEAYDLPDTYESMQGVMQVCVVLNDLIRRNLHYICVLAIALHNKRVMA